MHPKEISIQDFSYELPEHRIAKYPLTKRDESKLLVYRKGKILHDTFLHIADYIPENSLLLFNNTRVVEARILFQKPSGGFIEIFCLEPNSEISDISLALQQKGRVFWKCLIGGASKWKKAVVLEKRFDKGEFICRVQARFVEKKVDHFIIEFSWQPEEWSFSELLHQIGAIPLPPYIKRKAEESDILRYQTIYALHDGSVAAPTAGLHFTDTIFEKLQEKKIRTEWLTLHVGAGTFMPVKSKKLADHEMHAECIDISMDTIRSIQASLQCTIIPVGTTSLRTLESLYWMGVKSSLDPSIAPDQIGISQWESYELTSRKISPVESIQALIEWMSINRLDRLISSTRLLIAPGYSVRMASGIITNFHQPQSTLLLLIAALIGDDWKKVYAYALDHQFRFLSYGDGSLLLRSQV